MLFTIKTTIRAALVFSFAAALSACAPASHEAIMANQEPNISEELGGLEKIEGHDHETNHDDAGIVDGLDVFGCASASKTQLSVVNQGNTLYDTFLTGCLSATNNSAWCQQLTRPNPDSRSTFKCTYGSAQPHRLIHPDQKTWKNAYQAVKLIQRLQNQGVSVAEIYNWWRPEPYNKNVGGAAGRHPFGTSVDVRFSTMTDMKKAHALLCQWRAGGEMRALGYYGSTGLHFGIGDATANTWGKSCPQD